jgi:hypothetical protein
MRYVGIDLHKTKIAVCYLTNGKYLHRTFKINELDKFKATLLIDDELCFEATTNSAWFYRQCVDIVAKIVVVDTVKFKVISSSHHKTDKNDAKALALHLSKDMLPETKVKDVISDIPAKFYSIPYISQVLVPSSLIILTRKSSRFVTIAEISV